MRRLRNPWRAALEAAGAQISTAAIPILLIKYLLLRSKAGSLESRISAQSRHAGVGLGGRNCMLERAIQVRVPASLDILQGLSGLYTRQCPTLVTPSIRLTTQPNRGTHL